jgi:hypothetical protein
LNEVLHKFSRSKSLRINFDKFQMIPINVPQDGLDDFGYQMGMMPFTYLGLPLGTMRPTIVEISPLVCRLERMLTSSSSFLSQGVRLQLINSSLSSMPLHFYALYSVYGEINLTNLSTVPCVMENGLWTKE